jgi:hypothetical protein
MDEVDIAHMQGGGHEVVAETGDPPAMGARDLGDEVADVETFEDAGDPGGEGALRFWPVMGWVELPADVAILRGRH